MKEIGNLQGPTVRCRYRRIVVLAGFYCICITNGIFPECFKVAQVVSLFKGGDREDPNCYRPISLLPALGP